MTIHLRYTLVADNTLTALLKYWRLCICGRAQAMELVKVEVAWIAKGKKSKERSENVLLYSR